MKTVLLYGDSNTWGISPDGGRLDYARRLAGIIQHELSDGYRIIEEGLPGRTTVLDDPLGDYKNGLRYFVPCFLSHMPIQAVVIMLGTNDLQLCYRFPAAYSAEAIRQYIKTVRRLCNENNEKTPGIILVSPVEIADSIMQSEFYPYFGERSVEQSRQFASLYRKVASEEGIAFLDAATFARAGRDGVHITPDGLATLGKAIAEEIKQLLPG